MGSPTCAFNYTNLNKQHNRSYSTHPSGVNIKIRLEISTDMTRGVRVLGFRVFYPNSTSVKKNETSISETITKQLIKAKMIS